MHTLLDILLIWALVGGLYPCVLIASAVFVNGRWSAKKQVIYALLSGPQTWGFLIGCALIGSLMALRHRMRRGRPLVPPGTIAPPATPVPKP